MNMPVVIIVVNRDAEKADASDDYGKLLTSRIGMSIPDPLKLCDGWLMEKEGVSLWPPCMMLNISDYLLKRGDRRLLRQRCDRLSNDYNEGAYFKLKL